MAHGSRNPLANEELCTLAHSIESTLNAHYQHVGACYLEIAKPSLSALCEPWLANGALQIDIYPLFLNSGKHASEDIPQQVAALQQEHPSVRFNLLPYLGQHPQFAAIVSDHIQSNNN